MKNRFECLIKGLRAAGDEVMVFTPDRQPPAEYHGARVRHSCHDFSCFGPTFLRPDGEVMVFMPDSQPLAEFVPPRSGMGTPVL